MKRVNRIRKSIFLWMGMLFAYICVAVPIAFVLLMAYSGFGGGQSNVRPMLVFVVAFALAMIFVGELMSIGIFWLRWPIYAVLSVLTLVTFCLLLSLAGSRAGSASNDILYDIALCIGLVMSPCAIVLIELARKESKAER